MLWITFIVTAFPPMRVGGLRFCDKTFDLVNRTDESFERCRWLEKMTTSELRGCDGGVECEGECVPFSDWCRPHSGSVTPWRCGGLLSSPEVCTDQTFWAELPCPDSERCSGWWPGECRPYGGVCRDRSDQSGQYDWSQFCIKGGDTMVNISQLDRNTYLCQGKRNDTKVCAVRCDRRLDGCIDDEDEKDCPAKSHDVTLILVLIPCLILTLIIVESLRAGKVSTRLPLSQEESLEMSKDSDVAKDLQEFFRIILDVNNWDLGVRDDSNILKPFYHEGGFDVEKLSKIKQLYKSIRNSNMPGSLQYISYTIQMDQRLDDLEVSDALKHFSHCLIYRILEREYLESEEPTDLDVSIKEELNTRHSSFFYGQVFPYFDPIKMVTRKISLAKYLKRIQIFIDKIPHGRDIKYALLVSLSVLGWYIDFIKDILIAMDLSFLYKSFWDFKSQMVLVLWTTVFLSQSITGIYILVKFWSKPSQIFGLGINRLSYPYKILARIVFIFLAPVSPAVLIYVNKSRERKLRANEKELMILDESNISERIRLFKDRQDLLKNKDDLERLLRIAYKIDNVLENTPQLLIQLLIVLMSASIIQLPEVTGVEAVFDSHVEGNTLSTTFFYFSISWSLLSICTGHMRKGLIQTIHVNNQLDLQS